MTSPRRVTANTATFAAPLSDVGTAAKAAGFDGLEIWRHDVERFPGGAPAMGSYLRQAGLLTSAVQVLRDFEGCPRAERPARLADAEAMMAMVTELGADTMLVCANVQPSSSGDRREQADDLRGLAEMAAARHIRIAFEPLAWSHWINRYEATWDCVEAVNHPAFGLTLDCFHLFHQGSTVAFVDTIAMKNCFLVQLCDALPMPGLSARDIARHHRLLPGEGQWPIAELVRRLEARGYDGLYNMEVFNDLYRLEAPETLAVRAMASFRRLFEPTESTAAE